MLRKFSGLTYVVLVALLAGTLAASSPGLRRLFVPDSVITQTVTSTTATRKSTGALLGFSSDTTRVAVAIPVDTVAAPPPSPPPSPPGSFPPAFNPARLGAGLLSGHSWQDIVVAGTSDHGWVNLTAVVPFAACSCDGAKFPTSPATLGVYPDSAFVQAVRVTNPANKNGVTAQAHYPFPPTATVWVRTTFKFSPGFSSGPIGLPPGESGTYKLVFLFAGTGARMSFVLAASGEIAIEAPSFGQPQVALQATDTATPPAQPYGNFQGFYVGDKPTKGGPYPAGTMLSTGDWYSLTLAVVPDGSNAFLERWYIQRLTVGGVLAPWTYPTWKGFRVAGIPPPTFHEVWQSGNKSGAAATEQFLWFGPIEVSKLPDPYGWDHYGR